MTYHLKHWEYFIEMSCFTPQQMIMALSDSLKLLSIGVSGVAFSRIADDAKCARRRLRNNYVANTARLYW